MSNTHADQPDVTEPNDEGDDMLVAITEGSDEGDLTLPANSGPVQMNKNDRSIAEYYRWFKEKRIILDPDWQRGYLWDRSRASKLVESILMNIPIPVIYLAENEDHDYEVIDGVQRLTSLFKFLDNEFELRNLDNMKDLNGKQFQNLDKREQNRLRDETIRAFELSPGTSKELLFMIFERLNTGGVRLNEMEIRNCIYRGNLNNIIKKIADNQNFRECVNQKNLDKRMDDRSLVLRFLAFYERHYTKATSGLKSFLNEFFKLYRNPPQEKLSEFEKKFIHAMKASVTVFGNNGFRLRRTGPKGGGEWAPRINQTIFQVVAVSFTRFDLHQITLRSDAIMEEFLAIQDEDQRWIDAVTKSTGDASNIEYSFTEWNKRIDLVMRGSEQLDGARIFTRKLKEELWNNWKYCSICNNEIKTINDSALDHDIHYWRGGKTVPDNARLVHRLCNLKRPNAPGSP